MPTPPRKTGKTRKRLTKSSNSPDNHRERVAEHRERELVERAKHDSAVRKQLIQLMEEDPELIEIYSKHLQRKHGKNWDNFNPKIQAEKIKEVMEQYRIPQSKRGGRRRTKRRLKKRGKSRKIRKSRKKKGGIIDISRRFTGLTGMHKNIYSNIRHKLRNISREMEKQDIKIDIEIVKSNINDLNELLVNNSDYGNNDVSNCHPSIYSDKGNDGKSIYNLKKEIEENIYKLPLGSDIKNQLGKLLMKIANSDSNGCPSNYSY